MKREQLLTPMLLIAMGCTGLSFFLHCSGKDDAISENVEEVICGGFTDQHGLSDTEIAVFKKVLGKSQFTPLSVATQVVAGMNYRFWCRYDDGSGESPAHCFITVYQPLQGEPVISRIKDDNVGPEMKVIIDNEGNVGRYVSENESSYQGSIQDFYWIEKSKAKTEIYKACEGQGILTLKVSGTQPAYSLPDTKSDIIGTMIHEPGLIPNIYNCMGYVKGWFLTETDGKSGFIQEELVDWDAISSF